MSWEKQSWVLRNVSLAFVYNYALHALSLLGVPYRHSCASSTTAEQTSATERFVTPKGKAHTVRYNYSCSAKRQSISNDLAAFKVWKSALTLHY